MTNAERDELESEFFSRYDDVAERFGGASAAERDRLLEVEMDRDEAMELDSAYDSTFATAQRAADTLLASLESGISDLKRENALDVGSLVVLTDAPGGAIWRVVDIASGEALIESEGGRRFWRPVARLTVVSGAFRTLNPAALL